MDSNEIHVSDFLPPPTPHSRKCNSQEEVNESLKRPYLSDEKLFLKMPGSATNRITFTWSTAKLNTSSYINQLHVFGRSAFDEL